LTAQTFEGFLLTRNWRDTREGVELEFWFSTAQGPLCALVRHEQSVFFLVESALPQARKMLGDMPALEIKPVALRSFSMEPVVGLYFRQYRQARRAADELRAGGLDPLEADINPADRFLMERFVAGSAVLYGAPRRRGQYLLLEDPTVKACEYLPALKVVSFDIETDRKFV
jgi:DNA polymerase-2